MFKTSNLNGYSRPSNIFPLDKLADELILKGVLFLGVGLGLYITLGSLELITPNPECIIRSPS